MTDFSVPMPRRLKRSTKPIRPRKKAERRVGKLGIVRLSGQALVDLRNACYMRDHGLCRECGKPLLFDAEWKGHPDRYHMAHIGNKRMYGDTIENVRALCGDCHRAEHGNPRRGHGA